MPDKPNNGDVVKGILKQFSEDLKPLEKGEALIVLSDKCTGAQYCECHIAAVELMKFATVDVPLDPDDQPEYRANREIVEDSYAFTQMKEDAKKGRSFSNIVAEYTREFDPEKPLKIIGGQHRHEAIRVALVAGANELHGVKVYFALTKEQRLDVQLISNTNIQTSPDLVDRMQETSRGPQLRDWAQNAGLLPKDSDFADRYVRGGPVSVRMLRTFIKNFENGKKVNVKEFDKTDTTPEVAPSGKGDPEWDKLAAPKSAIWHDKHLATAAEQFAKLIEAQRKAFDGKKSSVDYPEKALNMAVIAAWAYMAGVLQSNPVRLKKHYDLLSTAGKDPLNAAVLAKGRHVTDPPNYRGLGYRTDPKERGRLVELFMYQAEKGDGINKRAVDVAILQYHAKQAIIAVDKAKEG